MIRCLFEPVSTPLNGQSREMMLPTLAAALFAVLAIEAPAQQRTFYASGGKVVGRASTDSSGNVTNYDVRGRVHQPQVYQRRHDDDL